MFFKHYRRIVGASASLLIVLTVISQLSCDTNKTALEECRREVDSLRIDLQVLIDSLSKPIEWEHRFSGPINLFYFNVDSSRVFGGPCSSHDGDAVLPIERNLPLTSTPVEDAIELWVAGELTEEERAAGFTAYQFDSVRLKRSILHNGILYLEFDDPKYETCGGTCKVLQLWPQVKRTALQFPQVRSVILHPEQFQP